jgi:hypothetical protein
LDFAGPQEGWRFEFGEYLDDVSNDFAAPGRNEFLKFC